MNLQARSLGPLVWKVVFPLFPFVHLIQSRPLKVAAFIRFDNFSFIRKPTEHLRTISEWRLQMELQQCLFPALCKKIIATLSQSAHLFLHTCVSPHTPTNGLIKTFFPNSLAETRNRIHMGRIEPYIRDPSQNTLPTELGWQFNFVFTRVILQTFILNILLVETSSGGENKIEFSWSCRRQNKSE